MQQAQGEVQNLIPRWSDEGQQDMSQNGRKGKARRGGHDRAHRYMRSEMHWWKGEQFATCPGLAMRGSLAKSVRCRQNRHSDEGWWLVTRGGKWLLSSWSDQHDGFRKPPKTSSTTGLKRRRVMEVNWLRFQRGVRRWTSHGSMDMAGGERSCGWMGTEETRGIRC